MKERLKVTPSPHIKSDTTVVSIMWDVVIALVPTIIAAIYFFGIKAITILVISVLTAIISEALTQKLMDREVDIINGSAVITGLLFALVVPPSLPWWLVIIGSSISIVIGKMIFGGLGNNIFNPALVGRAFLVASWPAFMTTWTKLDAQTGATPLGIFKESGMDKVVSIFGDKVTLYSDLFMGNINGSLGETSALAIIIGGLYLLYKKHISWHIPVVYIGTVAFLTGIMGHDPIFHIFSGGLMIGAFFMATDMVTSPSTKKGQIFFALGAGILVTVIRLVGGYPEGVAYSILIMNAFVPLIDTYVKPKIYGEVKS
ncbi:MAG: RnfABCDGE type electron transport complex subunit D [Fusobacteriota bacterium]